MRDRGVDRIFLNCFRGRRNLNLTEKNSMKLLLLTPSSRHGCRQQGEAEQRQGQRRVIDNINSRHNI